jgi:hypothetical protein
VAAGCFKSANKKPPFRADQWSDMAAKRRIRMQSARSEAPGAAAGGTPAATLSAAQRLLGDARERGLSAVALEP